MNTIRGVRACQMPNHFGTPLSKYRLIFLLTTLSESVEHYNQNLLTSLLRNSPIIPAVERSPAQPVAWQSRRLSWNPMNQVHICGNVLTLADYPYTPPVGGSNDPPKDSNHNLDLDFDEDPYESIRRIGTLSRVDTPDDKACHNSGVFR